MKKSKISFTPSQVVSLFVLALAVLLPVVVAELQANKIPVSPVYAALAVPLLTAAAGSCRSFLTRFSGTDQGLQFGTDFRSIANNAAKIAGIARKILGAAGTQAPPAAVVSTVNKVTAGFVSDAAATGSADPKDITGVWASSDLGTAAPPPAEAVSDTQLGMTLAKASDIKASDAPSNLPVIGAHSGEPFPLTADPSAEQPPPAAPGSIRELVPDWADPANAKA